MAARALGRCATIVRMDRGLRYKITVGAIVGVVLACGAVAAVAATGPDSGHRNAHRRQTAHQRVRDHGGTLAVASTYLGVSKTELRKDLREGKTLAQVAKETSGKSEAGLIEAIVAARKARAAANSAGLEKRVRARINRVGGLGVLGPGAGGSKAASASAHGEFAARSYLGLPAAEYLGVTAAQLQSDLQSGKTLAQVAEQTSGKSEAGLIEALVAARKERLAAAVTAGVFSQAQASTREAMLGKRITDLVNRRFSAAGAS